MSTATDQVAAWAARKDKALIGYRRASGLPSHPDGSPILTPVWDSPGERLLDQMSAIARETHADARSKRSPIPRVAGIANQGSLL